LNKTVSDHDPATHTDRAVKLQQSSISKTAGQTSHREEIAMKSAFLIAAIALVMAAGSGAGAADLPAFEARGFPISRHQVAVLGSAHVQEQSAVATLTWNEMPATPHQIAVLTPRQRECDRQMTMTGGRVTVGSAQPSPRAVIGQPH
jgi:hypothetical protein